MHKITEVKVFANYQLHVAFNDGVCGTVDFSDMVGKEVSAVWRDYRAFEQVRIGSSGELVWGDRIDLCPDALYLKVTGKKPEVIFPNLAGEQIHA